MAVFDNTESLGLVRAWLGDKAESIYGILFVPTFLYGLEV